VGITNSDYRTIQEAIDAAENGAKIIIKNGSYNELLVINKTITLIGEDKNTTIINFNPNYKISQVPIININADNCSIENLHITLSNNSVIAQGISINSKNNTIKNNIITKVANGIELFAYSESNTIINNEIEDNLIGIITSSSINNNISHNIFSNNTEYNIYLSIDSDNNKVSFNMMNNSKYGIRIKGSQNNKVYKNCIKNNELGIYCCCGANSNHFYNNTLLHNTIKNARQTSGLYNIWYDYPNGNGNYWDDYTGIDENQDGLGDIPYEIDGVGNQDIYPLMTPPIDAPCNK
jgi:parallel beta-helix repeat protein